LRQHCSDLVRNLLVLGLDLFKNGVDGGLVVKVNLEASRKYFIKKRIPNMQLTFVKSFTNNGHSKKAWIGYHEILSGA
jgi:hypothetical protein